ncbi:MAG: ABC transporter ATP-binding protein [Prochlorococcus sp.]|nr:ABC transporter ATP-binding protein [Prochlorococcaceae cyanobacterium Fu_MAG_50]
MLELRDLHYRPATAEQSILQGLNLQADRGIPVLVAGVSGSGKTSLLEVISGLSGAQQGSLSWQHKPVNQRQRRWLCGMVYQFPERHFLGLTVAQELRLGHRRLDSELQSQVLRRVGLSQVDLRQAPERLSGGQQRRLALAVQLMRQPEVLLLDEPTAGLDWSVRDDVLEMLANLAINKVLIVVTHEPELFHGWACSSHRLQAGQLQPISTLP